MESVSRLSHPLYYTSRSLDTTSVSRAISFIKAFLFPDAVKNMTTPPPHSEQPYRMPAEWEPHEATFIAWPHHRDDWPGKFAAIPWVYGEIVRQLHQSEKVFILVNGSAGEKAARAVLEKLPLDWASIAFYQIPTNRVWTRDYGPIGVLDAAGGVSFLNWQFNGWAKYANHRRDNAATVRLTYCFPVGSISPSLNG